MDDHWEQGTAASWARQAPYAVRFEWGPPGVEALGAEHVVVVDVLRFSTAVEAAVTQGAVVYPYRWRDTSAEAFARAVGAELADGRDPTGASLSPVRLLRLRPGDKVVLPSPNGSTCAAIAAAQGATVVAGCLRNARAVAASLHDVDGSVGVIACGERWPDGTLRPSLEDYLGAGAVISELRGPRSPEAAAAAALYEAVRDRVGELVRSSASGQELVERGRADDVDYAVEIGASSTVPVLLDGAFANGEPRPRE